MDLKEIKKVLMTGNGKIMMGNHTKRRIKKRGYTKGDIVSAIFTGKIVEHQGLNRVAIAGKDRDDNPIVVIIAKTEAFTYLIVTVMPPIDHNRFVHCV